VSIDEVPTWLVTYSVPEVHAELQLDESTAFT
jgi:hypothetical protein